MKQGRAVSARLFILIHELISLSEKKEKQKTV